MEQVSQNKKYLNFGVLGLHQSAQTELSPESPRTIIVTGVGRSGTSMTANVLHSLGVSMGDTRNKAVFEDQEFTDTLFNLQHHRLQPIIAKRNATSKCWGFKFPSLQNHLFPPQLSYFRNPRLIVIMRDPIAVASRATISDPKLKGSVEEALYNVSKQTSDMIFFLQKSSQPALLLSYEKFLSFPENALDAIIEFCGLTVDAQQRAEALQAVSPNNDKYIKLFHSGYRGHFDGINQNVALGWCKAIDSDAPLDIQFLVDDVVITRSHANVFRPDLKQAGIGAGNHSFRINLANLSLPNESVLSIRTEDGWLLPGSGQSLAKLRKDRPPA
jgi:hypothetical protein